MASFGSGSNGATVKASCSSSQRPPWPTRRPSWGVCRWLKRTSSITNTWRCRHSDHSPPCSDRRPTNEYNADAFGRNEADCKTVACANPRRVDPGARTAGECVNVMKRNRAFVCAVLIALVGAAASTRAQAQSPEPATHDHTGAGGTPLMVPRDLEMRLAVNALPRPLRDGASVLVLEPTGYVKAPAGTNAFTCKGAAH